MAPVTTPRPERSRRRFLGASAFGVRSLGLAGRGSGTPAAPVAHIHLHQPMAALFRRQGALP